MPDKRKDLEQRIGKKVMRFTQSIKEMAEKEGITLDVKVIVKEVSSPPDITKEG